MLLSLDHIKVEYEQQGKGPDLLLLHSLLTELTVFDGVLPALAARRRVTRIDLPGFGQSSAVRLESVADHADHVARVMDALRLPRDSAVFGNGFGAFVALELALRHGERFGALLVADTLAAFPEPARAPFRAMAERVSTGGMQAVIDAAIARMLPPAFAERNAPAVERRKKALGSVDPQCFARACLALAGLDLTPRLGKLRKRVLVMCGELDHTTPPALARSLAELIPGAAYRQIAASGHCPMLEQPDTLVRFMLEFLENADG
jgi:pimeloyl-ACP methyl ester carboxylesterase